MIKRFSNNIAAGPMGVLTLLSLYIVIAGQTSTGNKPLEFDLLVVSLLYLFFWANSYIVIRLYYDRPLHNTGVKDQKHFPVILPTAAHSLQTVILSPFAAVTVCLFDSVNSFPQMGQFLDFDELEPLHEKNVALMKSKSAMVEIVFFIFFSDFYPMAEKNSVDLILSLDLLLMLLMFIMRSAH